MAQKRLISAQLRLGDAEISSHQPAAIMEKISAAHKHAGLGRLLFLPSHSPGLNREVVEHCRRLGIEIYLWYKVLTDNDIIPERNELVEDAWGRNSKGESGVWKRVFESEENYLFCCPNHVKYNRLVLNRCRQAVEMYDGLFADCIGFPLVSLGLEGVFSCFCPACREVEPRLEEWRHNVFALREAAVSASDADLERYRTLEGSAAAFGLSDLFRFREQSLINVARQYAELAREMGKGFGLDLVSPALSFLGSHDYRRLSALADWVKPRIYWRVFGPSSIPVEMHSLAMGMIQWGKRYTIPGVLGFIERSSGLAMPHDVHSLSQNYMRDSNVYSQISRAVSLSSSPVHLAFECSQHPEYNTGITEASIKNFLQHTVTTPGLVLTWNLLYVPDHFLRIIGENR